MKPFPNIRTSRLILREIVPEDAKAVFAIFSKPEVTEHYDCYPFTTESEASSWIEGHISSYEECGHQGFRWAIAQAETPEQLIGSCGFHSVHADFKSFEVGYELHPEFGTRFSQRKLWKE